MTRWRPSTTNLRLLLLGALGGAVWACAGETSECTAGDPACADDAAAGGSGGSAVTTGGSGGGAATGGTATESGGFGGDLTLTGGTGGAFMTSGCTNPVPRVEGVDTGIFDCAEGYPHRAVASACPNELPRSGATEWPEWDHTVSADDCSMDTDCPEQARCLAIGTSGNCPPSGIPAYARVCVPGCVEDSDCADNEVCLCGDDIGTCTPMSEVAGCHDDSDCDTGFMCLRNAVVWNGDYVNGPTISTFACQLPGDECDTYLECPTERHSCEMGETHRECVQGIQCGRPFLIEEEARKAAPITSAAWLTSSLAEVEVPADAALRDQLAAHWTEIGLMEHASVAAFARFTLQLLSLGAPADLVEQSQRAALDEVRHAELAFALASRYAGRAIGPGPLPLTGALDASSVEAILRTTVREGCIGETRAALEASRAAEPCEDPVVRSVLETIAADEARHAELAWKVVRFIVTSHPEMAAVLTEEFGSLARQEKSLAAVDGPAAETNRFGVLTPGALERCHREAYTGVIAPCARTLLAMTAGA